MDGGHPTGPPRAAPWFCNAPLVTAPAQTFPPLHDLSRVPPGTVLVVAPHPDDEILGCGGAIALHVDRGDPVHVVLVTAGDVGGDAEQRLAESRAAAAHLGGTAVSCLGVPDGAVASTPGVAEQLAQVVARVAPRVVYAPSPFEMHRDHVATLDAVGAALALRTAAVAAAPLDLLLYEVNTECMASFLLDITGVWARKRAAIEAFGSQIGIMDLVMRFEARARARAINVDLPAVSHAEGFVSVRPDDVAGVREHVIELGERLGLDRGGT